MNCLYDDGREAFLSDEELKQIRFASDCCLAWFIYRLLGFVEYACIDNDSLGAEGSALLDEKNHPEHQVMQLADFLRKQPR